MKTTHLGGDELLDASLDSRIDEWDLAQGRKAADSSDDGILPAKSVNQSWIAVVVFNDGGAFWLLGLEGWAGEKGDVEVGWGGFEGLVDDWADGAAGRLGYVNFGVYKDGKKV